MSKVIETAKAITAKIEVPEREYVGHYMYRNRRPEPKVKCFKFRGDVAAANVRWKEHCDIMGYRYISVVPWIADLDFQEKKRAEDPDYDAEI